MENDIRYQAVMNQFNEMVDGRRMAEYVIAGIAEETDKKFSGMVDMSKPNEPVKLVRRRK